MVARAVSACAVALRRRVAVDPPRSPPVFPLRATTRAPGAQLGLQRTGFAPAHECSQRVADHCLSRDGSVSAKPSSGERELRALAVRGTVHASTRTGVAASAGEGGEGRQHGGTEWEPRQPSRVPLRVRGRDISRRGAMSVRAWDRACRAWACRNVGAEATFPARAAIGPRLFVPVLSQERTT